MYPYTYTSPNMCLLDKKYTRISDIYCNSDQEQLHTANCYKHIWAQHVLCQPDTSQVAKVKFYLLLMATVCCSFQWKDMGLSTLTLMDEPFTMSNVK
jgi:hypothetical protein